MRMSPRAARSMNSASVGTEQVDARIGDAAEFVQLKRATFHVQAHFRRSRIARPMTQSLSLSDRKLSSSVKWVTRWR
jgi:hypothetical protein